MGNPLPEEHEVHGPDGNAPAAARSAEAPALRAEDQDVLRAARRPAAVVPDRRREEAEVRQEEVARQSLGFQAVQIADREGDERLIRESVGPAHGLHFRLRQ